MSYDTEAFDIPEGAFNFEFHDLETFSVCSIRRFGNAIWLCRRTVATASGWETWRKPTQADIHRLMTVYKKEGK